eukprot:14746442-Alexandrium_andersonii.AAC.1
MSVAWPLSLTSIVRLGLRACSMCVAWTMLLTSIAHACGSSWPMGLLDECCMDIVTHMWRHSYTQWNCRSGFGSNPPASRTKLK